MKEAVAGLAAIGLVVLMLGLTLRLMLGPFDEWLPAPIENDRRPGASSDSTYEPDGATSQFDDYAERPQPQPWTCVFSPTYNRNWHDDVLCSDGVSTHRPALLPYDSFVTQAEILEEARAYEDYLNDR